MAEWLVAWETEAKNLRRNLRKICLILNLKMKLSVGTIMLYNKQL